ISILSGQTELAGLVMAIGLNERIGLCPQQRGQQRDQCYGDPVGHSSTRCARFFNVEPTTRPCWWALLMLSSYFKRLSTFTKFTTDPSSNAPAYSVITMVGCPLMFLKISGIKASSDRPTKSMWHFSA